MAGERTRRFTRSLLRPGQAAELRHSAASAAAVAVSSRQQQRPAPSLLALRPAPRRTTSARQRCRRLGTGDTRRRDRADRSSAAWERMCLGWRHGGGEEVTGTHHESHRC
ncbi:unnamed protein product [Rangifer tarandus platyrhynchus]|uniref:Uncharacterized protein n=1 Tax=Rangifer tarandus platyrhynchus TaxID=3082113 RepID=A0ABN8YUR4_RANTA|nr:unnamed protein product [Rangifer tarandus platyrhynchus]